MNTSNRPIDANLQFCRTLLKVVLKEVDPLTSGAERKAAWVYDLGMGHWEFHGPKNIAGDEFYWHGSADNAYDARATGWQKWLGWLEDNASESAARSKGVNLRAVR